MKRYTFGSFLVDDANRQSYELCKEIAELRPISGQPLILLGDKGCGKSHLLYAIVNRVRSATGDAGIAYVSPGDFPEQVKALLRDSTPLDKVASAILLVDHLERFQLGQIELERVMRLFLDRGETVVVATSVHPKRLTFLSPGIKRFLDHGRLVQIQPQTLRGRMESLEQRIRDESEAIVARQRQEIEALEAKLKTVSDASVSALRDELRSRKLEREVHELKAELGETRTMADRLGEELRRIDSERSALSYQANEAETLRERVRGLEAALEEAQSANAVRAHDVAEAEALRRELDAARRESDTARLEADGLLGRAEALLDELQRGRERFNDAQQEHEKQLREIRELEALLAGESLGMPGVDETLVPPAELDELLQRQRVLENAREEERVAHRAAMAALEAERDRALSERDAALEAFESFRVEAATAQGKFDEVRAMVEATNNELGGLRASVDEARQEADTWARHAADAEAERDLLKQDLGEAQEEVRAWEAKVKHLQEEQSILRDALEEARFEARMTQSELRSALEGLERQKAGLEAIRVEATEQVAETSAEAESWRQRFEEAVGQLETRNTLRTGISGGLKRLHDELGDALGSVGSLMQRLETTSLERLRTEGGDVASPPTQGEVETETPPSNEQPMTDESPPGEEAASEPADATPPAPPTSRAEEATPPAKSGNGHRSEIPSPAFEPMRAAELPRADAEPRRTFPDPLSASDPATFEMPKRAPRQDVGLHHVEDFEDDLDLLSADEASSEEPVHHRFAEYDDDTSI